MCPISDSKKDISKTSVSLWYSYKPGDVKLIRNWCRVLPSGYLRYHSCPRRYRETIQYLFYRISLQRKYNFSLMSQPMNVHNFCGRFWVVTGMAWPKSLEAIRLSYSCEGQVRLPPCGIRIYNRVLGCSCGSSRNRKWIYSGTLHSSFFQVNPNRWGPIRTAFDTDGNGRYTTRVTFLKVKTSQMVM